MRRVVRRFGDQAALAAVDLRVAPGEIHALLGPNGAGKTTLIRILCGLVEPDAGEVSITGPVGFVPSGDRTFYLRISGLENLIFFARLQGLRLRSARRRALEVLQAVDLGDAGALPVGRYSHGMQKRLAVARALLVDPAVLLVDEATHDLDPRNARRVRALVRSLAERGAAVLWATQRIEEIRGFADQLTFLHHGQVSFAGSVLEFVSHAPSPRYLVRLQNGGPDQSPPASALERALRSVATITAADSDGGQFLLAPHRTVMLGAVLAALAESGFEVLACRPENAELEEAFMELTSTAST